jgi:hypothetical protein
MWPKFGRPFILKSKMLQATEVFHNDATLCARPIAAPSSRQKDCLCPDATGLNAMHDWMVTCVHRQTICLQPTLLHLVSVLRSGCE